MYALVVVGCALDSGAPPSKLSTVDQDATVCGAGPTVKGIDVSYYQGTIDWAAVKSDGVHFAFIRVSDGTNFIDPKFESYWSGSRTNGIVHGAYQFFRPSNDVQAQADLLLSKVGTQLAPDDLPPVLDVEATDGESAASVAAKVKQWVDYVGAALGRPPIIYTGFYFWRDSVGAPDDTTSPLWHAQYTTASCPNIAPPWSDWAIWQYSSTGSVAGISGGVDMDRWNGDQASLTGFLGPAQACGTVGAAGAVIDDGDPCFEVGGSSAYMRHVLTAGEDGDLVWTHTTDDAAEANFGQWNLDFDEAGTYKLEVYTDAAFAQSKAAKYLVHTADGDMETTIDQSASDGWQTLGNYTFAAGGDQYLHLADNTGEPVANNVQLVFDAARLTRVTDGGDGSGSGSGSGDGSGSGSDDGSGKNSGCAVGGNGLGLGLVLALVGLRRRRRR